MKCSDCGKPVRPVVVLDIDGVLANYHDSFHAFAERYVDASLPLLYDGSTEFSDWLGLDKRTYRDIKLAYRQGGNKRWLEPYPYIHPLIRSIHAAGAELWLATTRPYLRLDNIDPDTREWLRRNEIKYDGLIFDEAKYERLIELVDKDRIVGVVEDILELCEAAYLLGLEVWQPWRQHNSGSLLYPDSHMGLGVIAEGLRIDIAKWKEQHER